MGGGVEVQDEKRWHSDVSRKKVRGDVSFSVSLSLSLSSRGRFMTGIDLVDIDDERLAGSLRSSA